MDKHAKMVLEFDQIISTLKTYCICEHSATELDLNFIQSSQGFEALRKQLHQFTRLVYSLVKYLQLQEFRPQASIVEIGSALTLLDKEGAVLDLEHIADILKFISGFETVRHFLNGLVSLNDNKSFIGFEQELDFFRKFMTQMPDLRQLGQFLKKYIDEQGLLKEDQIPELRAARQHIISRKAELAKNAQSIISQNQAIISGDFATSRDGRLVIPLKADFKGRVAGLVHQSSSSGATLYLEPYELVEKNNAVSQAENEYHQEIIRIIRMLSNKCAVQKDALDDASQALLDFDKYYCRALFACDYQGQMIKTDKQISLLEARHPLLGRQAVPIDLVFPKGKRLLVVSGPNTGGKTVALKTLGLFTLMNQAGFLLPCNHESSMPLFNNVFADIGDEQSISASLSTFSGHLAQIAHIIRYADHNSLILVDELGSGTDPDEGAALALAVVERLLELEPHMMITSHHSAIKALAISNPLASNASMAFSDTEHKPTYRVVAGVPGQSHALDIAEYLGFEMRLISRARDLHQNKETSLDQLLKSMQAELASAQELRLKNEKIAADLDARTKLIEEKQTKLQQWDLDLQVSQQNQASDFLKHSRSHVEKLLRELSDFKTTLIDDQKKQEVEAQAKKTREELLELSKLEEAQRQALDAKRKGQKAGLEIQAKSGDMVRLLAGGISGTLEQQNKDGTWQANFKGKRMKLSEGSFELVAGQGPTKKPKVSFTYEQPIAARLSVDVRGMRMGEANDHIIKQLDAAHVQGIEFFYIIHGKGEGILQTSIRAMLAQSPLVQSLEYALPQDGGTGKTIVFLKR